MAASMTTRSPLVPTLLRQQRDAEDAEHVLVGCSLPPKVTGVPRGAVLLSVPRILSSVAAEAIAENEELPRAVLPRVALVRVRWWGEDKPGSTLFRPKCVAQDASRRRDDEEQAHDDGGVDGDSLLCMRYPVCVPAQQLLDYLRDMKELVLDVIDRETRKKVGRGVFPFVLNDADSSSPVDVMKRLRRTDALCEIHAAAPPHGVLGYLTVNFEIEWTAAASSTAESLSTPLKWTSSASLAPAINVNPAMLQSRLGITLDAERRIQQRLSFSSMSSSCSGTTPQESQVMPAYRSVVADERPASKATRPVVAPDRLEVLLEKGRALQRSMSVATKKEATVPSTTMETISAASAAVPSSPVMPTTALLVSYEAMTEEVDSDWEHVLAQAQESPTTPGAKETRAQAAAAMRHRVEAIPISLGEYNALEISFEAMELQQETIDRLRQLREGSVSTRFSPIQLVVSHEHPRFVFAGTDGNAKDKWIAAFAVNSSLRKRQWRTNYSHTLPLDSHDGVVGKPTEHHVQVQQRALRFWVRCEPQHASPTGKRRRDTRQRLDLWTEVSVQELLENRERGRVLSLPLRLGDDRNQDTKKTSTTKRKRQPVGSISVKFRFCSLPHNEGNDDMGSESRSARSVSSNWSLGRSRHEATDPLRATPPRKQPRSPLLGHRHTGAISGSLFLALLIDQATIRLSADLEESLQGLAEREKTSRLSLRLDYGTPAFFGRAAKTLRLKRSAKARLRRSKNGVMRAAVNHMNAFPIDVTDEFVEKLQGGLLILEVWLQEQSKALTSYLTEKLLGIIKVPLRDFSPLMRDADRLFRALENLTPIIGVDQEFPIIDPLTDNVNGQIQVRLGLGTADQLFHFKSTLAAVVKLQSLVRGWLARRELQYWQQFELVDVGDGENSHKETPPGQNGAVNASEASSHPGYGEMEHALESSGHDNSVVSVRNVWQPELSQPIVRVKIQVEIRENYGRANRDIIGCEVYGLLRFQDEHAIASLLHSSGPRFTLWWDAQDPKLNSHFVHSFQASDPLAGIHLQDMALLFRVEPQFAATRRVGDESDAAPKGVAAIDLAEAVATHGGQSAQFDGEQSLIHLNIDVPIEWSEPTKAAGRQYASRLPLRISLQLSRGSVQPRVPQSDELVLATESHTSEQPRERVTTLETVSRTERLLPATLRLCLDIQRVSDVKELVLARLAAAKQDANESQIEELLGRAIESGGIKTTLTMSLCLGTERHPYEEDNGQREATMLQDDHGRWIKQFRFQDIELQVRDGVQSLPSITQGDADVMVHPELVSFLQEGSLDVELLLNDDNDASLGTVSIPLAPIVFRPGGVQGSFPVRVCDDALSGRIGVHLYIEQEPSAEIVASQPQGATTQETNELSVSSNASSSDPATGGSIVHSVADSDDEEEESTKDEDIDDDDAEWFSERSISEAVGSMHETSRSIDQRLARMKSQSTRVDFLPLNPDSAVNFDQNVVETELNGSIASAVETSDIKRADDAEEELQDGYLGSDSERQTGASTEIQANEHDLDAEESCDDNGESQHQDGDEDAQDGSFYKPITLESLGIGEIELSPVVEPSLPPLTLENSVLEATSPGFEMDEEDGLWQELDNLSERGASTLDGKEQTGLESDSDDGDIDFSQLEIRSHGGDSAHKDEVGLDDTSMPSGPSSPRRESLDSSKETTIKAGDDEVPEPVQRQAPETVVGFENEDMPSHMVEEESPRPKRVNDTDANDTASLADSLVEETQRESNDVDVDANSTLADDVDGHNILELEASSPDDAPVAPEPVDEASSETPIHLLTDECTVQEEPRGEEATQGAVDVAPEADSLTELETSASTLQRVRLDVCDDATQTEELEGSEAAAAPRFEVLGEETSEGRDVEPRVSLHAGVDSACQTAIDDTNSMDPVSITTNQAEEVVASNGLPTSTNNEVEGMVPATSPQQLALPADKFNLAWQLLTEIRSLYVDTGVHPPVAPEFNTPADDSSTDAPEDIEQPGETEPTVTTTDPDVAVEGPAWRSKDTEVVVEQAKPQDVGPIWEWRDEQSLRAEVDERLRQSKREYEEALALSQSVHSVKSWSSSFADDDRRQKAEQIAIDLSASALDRRARNARAKLFRADTETERIARIMQGSLSYWVREDEDEEDDYDDQSSDDEAFGYF